MTTRNYPYVVSCDWFSYACSCEGGHVPNEGDEFRDPCGASRFRIVAGSENHPFYESSAKVMEGNAPVAHLFYRCKRADNPMSCQVKVDNSRLYYPKWGESLQALVRALGWRVMRIARVDVCCDFNYFANGRLPLLFLKDYLREPTACRCSFIRHSSNRFRVHGVRFMNDVRYETISWGTRDSAVQTNLYDKSLELIEHADKPWIRQRWIEHGLLHGEVDGHVHHVWRVEFSIDPSAIFLRPKQPRDPVRDLSLADVCSPAALADTFQMLHPRYFRFHALSKQAASCESIRVRDLPDVTLFERDDCQVFEVRGLRYYRKSTRADYILLSKLSKAADEIPMTESERVAFYRFYDRLVEVTTARSIALDRDAQQYDVVNAWLRDCFTSHVDMDRLAPVSSDKALRRSTERWVRMLKGVRDESLDKLLDALRMMEEMMGTSVFESCVQAANYVAGGFLPDEAIAAQVDEEVFSEAFHDMPPLDPQ